MVIQALERIAHAWNEAGFCYAVLHGLEGYPERVGRDLDILVAAEQVEDVLATARSVFESKGWQVARPPGTWGERIVAFGEQAVEIHAVTEVSWRVVTFSSSPKPATELGPFQVDPWAAFAKRVLMPAFAGDPERFKGRKRADFVLASHEEPFILERLTSFVAPGLARQFLESVAAGNHDQFVQLLPELRRDFLQNALKTPGRTAATALGKAVRGVKALLFPTGLVVALVGPRGAEKAEVLEALKRDPSVFTGFTFRQRPALLPPLGSGDNPKSRLPSRSDATAPRDEKAELRWLRASYCYFDFLCSYVLEDRKVIRRQQVVFYDVSFFGPAGKTCVVRFFLT